MGYEPTISLAGHTFAATKGAKACSHVMAGAPVLLFLHEADGSLQFMCGAAGHGAGDAIWIHAAHLLDRDPELKQLPVVNFGFEAERDGPGEAWTVHEIPESY